MIHLVHTSMCGKYGIGKYRIWSYSSGGLLIGEPKAGVVFTYFSL